MSHDNNNKKTIPALGDGAKSGKTAKDGFHQCCGKCPEARKAAATGAPVEPHVPCHLREKPAPKAP